MTTSIPFAGCFTDADDVRLAFIGIADDSQSSFLEGAAKAPPVIRSAYDGNAFNATTESGVDLSASVNDLGDLRPGKSWEQSAAWYRKRLEEVWRSARAPFIAGGDHAITVPVLEALGRLGRRVHVIQFDAHPDLYPAFEENPASHACTAARLLEMDHVITLTQLGIRTMNAVQAAVRDAHAGRLVIYEARELPGPIPALAHLPDGADVYVTVDMDGFDPAFAPGVSHPVPGGLSSRQVLGFLQRGRFRLIGMDVVEVNPSRDVGDRTAILAARLLHEGMGLAVRGDTLAR